MQPNWKKIGCYIVCLFLLNYLPANAQTLKQAVSQTLTTNPNVLIRIKAWLAAKKGIRQAQGGYLPSLDLNANVGTSHSRNFANDFEFNNLTPRGAELTLSQMIFDGFATSSEVARNKNLTLADAYQVQGSAEDISLLAVKSYLDVLRSQQLVNLAQQNYAAHLRTYKMIKSRAKSGLNRLADITQSFGRLALAKANLLATQNNMKDANTVYYKVVGIAPKSLILPTRLKASDIPNSKQNAVQYAITNHPLLKSAKADVLEAKSQHEAAKAPFYPRLDMALAAEAGRDIDGVQGNSNDYAAFLRLHYNFFDGGSDLAKLHKTAYLVQQAREVRNRTHDQVIENMELAWNSYQTANAQLLYFNQHQVAARVTVQAYKDQFKLGKRTLLDLLNSEEELFRARNDYVNGQYNLVYAKYRILNAEGKLLEYLKIPGSQSHVNNVTSADAKKVTQQPHSTRAR